MPAWITLSKEVWQTGSEPGFYIGGPSNWKAVFNAGMYPANNEPSQYMPIKFSREDNRLKAFVKDNLLVLMMVAGEDGHALQGLTDGFMWDNSKWVGGVIRLADGLVKISEHSERK